MSTAHALNLAVQDCVKECQQMRETLAVCSEICAAIRSSPKRNAMLESLKASALATDDDVAHPGRIVSFCLTRYIKCRLQKVMWLYNVVSHGMEQGILTIVLMQ